VKTTFAFVLGLGIAIGSVQGQECPSQKSSCQAVEICEAPSENKIVTAFKALKPEAQKEVREAMTFMAKSCPMGSRMAPTMVVLDRLYSDAIANLEKVAGHEKCDAALKTDLTAQVATLKQLHGLNADVLIAMKTIMGGDGCCGEAKAEGKADEKAEAKDCSENMACCSESTVALADKLVESWAKAPEELAKVKECKETMAKFMAGMETLKKNGIDCQVLSASMTKQVETIGKACGGLACPASGLMAKHADVMSACDATNTACSTSVKEVVAAAKLLKAMNAAMGKGGECGETKGEVKGECSETKSECSEKKECCSGEKAKECCGEKAKK
jgi:hypothetical protein